jgi:hypothetical protein
MAELSRRLEQMNQHNSGSIFALSNRLTQIRYAFYSEDSPERRNICLKQLTSLVDEIVSSPDNSDVLKVQARIQLLETEGHQFVFEFLREMGDCRIKLALGHRPDLAGLLQTQISGLKDLETKTAGVLKDTLAFGSPSLISVAMVTRGYLFYLVLLNQVILSLLFDRPIKLQQTVVQEHIDSTLQAIEIFRQAGNLEHELRAKMLLADLYQLIGRQSDAQQIAEEIMPTAKIMEYTNLISRAEIHISGNSLQNQIAENVRPKSEQEKATSNAEMSDEKIRMFAAQMHKLLELSPECFPVLERDYKCLRDIAGEKLHWCKHIEILQDRTHEQDHKTLYRADPSRVCICSLNKHRSILESTDWITLISAFKRCYCESCTDRTPF